jgi:multisubunit Na+/H+ antiporter MnhG subunit
MIASLDDYLPLADLAKIVAVCIVVAVIAPAAVSVAIVGLDRRAQAETRGRTLGIALIVVGVAALAALVVAGIYALDVH